MKKIDFTMKQHWTNRRQQPTIPMWPRLAAFGIAIVPALFSCAPTTMNGDKDPAAAAPNIPSIAQAPQQAADQQTEAVKVQELSVHEEGGQTSLTVKLSKAISQYRHFPLPQPSRIVLDVFNDARPADTESYRVGTTLVSYLKVS